MKKPYIDLKPTTEEVRDWLLSTLRHSCHVEYYLTQLNLGKNDPQRPHDIIGSGNKYSWPVIEGLALQGRKDQDPAFFDKYVLPSIKFHRRNQHHHQNWNWFNPDANDEELKVGAVNALCSLLENRQYQGGKHSFDEIVPALQADRVHQIKWLKQLLPEMKIIIAPDLESITSLDKFPNLGLPDETYQKIVSRTEATLKELKTHVGYPDL